MQIKAMLFSMETGESVQVIFADKYLVPLGNLNMLNPKIRHPFQYEFSEAVKIKSRGKFNTIITYNRRGTNANQLFTHLNRIQNQRMKWMFGEHHFQKHWKDYAAWLIAPLAALLIGKVTGVLDAVLRYIYNSTK